MPKPDINWRLRLSIEFEPDPPKLQASQIQTGLQLSKHVLALHLINTKIIIFLLNYAVNTNRLVENFDVSLSNNVRPPAWPSAIMEGPFVVALVVDGTRRSCTPPPWTVRRPGTMRGKGAAGRGDATLDGWDLGPVVGVTLQTSQSQNLTHVSKPQNLDNSNVGIPASNNAENQAVHYKNFRKSK